jgi:hypothetical protein
MAGRNGPYRSQLWGLFALQPSTRNVLAINCDVKVELAVDTLSDPEEATGPQ